MKPVVRYKIAYGKISVGTPAIVFPIDHPSELVSNTNPALTSTVIRVGENGEFETKNTIYKLEESA